MFLGNFFEYWTKNRWRSTVQREQNTIRKERILKPKCDLWRPYKKYSQHKVNPDLKGFSQSRWTIMSRQDTFHFQMSDWTVLWDFQSTSPTKPLMSTHNVGFTSSTCQHYAEILSSTDGFYFRPYCSHQQQNLERAGAGGRSGLTGGEADRTPLEGPLLAWRWRSERRSGLADQVTERGCAELELLKCGTSANG